MIVVQSDFSNSNNLFLIFGWIFNCLLTLAAIGGMTLVSLEQWDTLRKKKLV